MGMVVFAAVCSVLALLTGIAAIGSGSHWQFNNKDILKGKRNAVLYVWVTLSSMFSLAHTTKTIGYLIDPVWGFTQQVSSWFLIHGVISLLISAAHVFIYLSFETKTVATDDYLWGSRRVR